MTKKWLRGGEEAAGAVVAAVAPAVSAGAPEGMNAAFKLIFQVLAALLYLLFIGYLVIGFIDVISYIMREKKQKLQIQLDPRLVNKDTSEMEAIQYVKNDVENEPYNIFLQQQLVSAMFILIGLAVLAFGSQFALFMGLSIYVKIRGKGEVAEKMQIPFQYLGVIVIVLIIAVSLNAFYRAQFLKKIQPNLGAIENRMKDIKSFIYSNLSTDPKFLQKLTSGNYEEPIQYMAEHAAKTKNTFMLARMMFTLNLYSYFDSAFAEGDVNTDAVKDMFTPVGIRKRKVNPSYYLLYRQSAHIPDMYTTAAIRDALQPALGDREQEFVSNTTNLMRTLNKQLSGLGQLRKGKMDVKGYLFNNFRMGFLFLFLSAGVLFFLFYKELEPVRETVKAFLKKLLDGMMTLTKTTML